jgi:hypothetical protein
MPIAAGPIALVDPLQTCRSPAAFENLTPSCRRPTTQAGIDPMPATP